MKKALRFYRAFRFFKLYPCLGRDDVCGTGPFFALSDVEGYLLAFIEGCEARGLNFGMMDEQIISCVIRDDKSITLTCVKPFYCTCTHLISPFKERLISISLFVYLEVLLRDEIISPVLIFGIRA